MAMVKWDFACISTLKRRKEKEDSWLNAIMIKTKIAFVKGWLNFSSKSTTTANVYFMDPLWDNWPKNNHITIDIIYHVRSLLVSVFFTSFSFQTRFSTAIILEGAKRLCIKRTKHYILQIWVSSSNSCDRLWQVEERIYEVEIKKSQFSL